VKLWILRRKKDRPQYDVCDGFVIRAATEQQARALADWKHGDEGQIWMLPEEAFCEELTTDGPSMILLVDFNAG